jgi:phosphate transport system permease protein
MHIEAKTYSSNDKSSEASKNKVKTIKKSKKFNWRRIKDSGIKGILFFCALFSAITVFFILCFLVFNGYQLFEEITLWEFLSGDRWYPTAPSDEAPVYFGAWPLIVGTFLVTLGAMAFAIPLGIFTAIYLSQFAHPKIRDPLKTGIELLSGVPSVVFGLFGLLLLNTWIMTTFDEPSGKCWLAGSILLGIMALPTIITVAEDAISAVPRELKEASLALGASKWETVSRVTVPAAMSGITAAIILGMGRAIGETIAVMMVIGNAPVIPDPLWDVFSPIQTITAAIATEMGEAPVGSPHEHALFSLGVLLFVIILVINSFAIYFLTKLKEKHVGLTKPKKQDGIRKKIDKFLTIPDRFREMFNKAFKWLVVIVILTLLIVWFGILIGIAILLILFLFRYLMKGRTSKSRQRVAVAMLISSTLIVLFMLGIILLYIIVNGLPMLNWTFITGMPEGSFGFEGGIFPAIVGTLFLVGGAILFAIPLGIGAGIYLSEYAKEGKIVKIVRAGIDNLNGTPSIVFGLFGYLFLVFYLGWGRSLLAGQVILGLMILPTIIRTTEEAVKSVPQSMREGSLALGASKWQTIRKVVLPPASPGIVTGGILGIGRAAGETAPILFTAVALITYKIPNSPFEPVMALPYYIFEMALNVPEGKPYASAAALILLLFVLSVYGSAAILRNKFRKKMRW